MPYCALRRANVVSVWQIQVSTATCCQNLRKLKVWRDKEYGEKKILKKVSRKCNNIFKIHLRTSQSWYLQDVKWCKCILYSSLCYWHRHKANKSQKEHIAHQSLWSARFLKTTSSYPVSASSQIRAALAMSPKWYSYHVTNWSPWSTHYDAVSRCRHWKSTAIPNIRTCAFSFTRCTRRLIIERVIISVVNIIHVSQRLKRAYESYKESKMYISKRKCIDIEYMVRYVHTPTYRTKVMCNIRNPRLATSTSDFSSKFESCLQKASWAVAWI